jgi:hypothetical protein
MSTRAANPESQPAKFDFALLDSILLGVLIALMCSQLNLGDIGKDTTAQGYVTKQLKVALPDIALFLGFVWFALRTTALRAWRKVWWPPFPCWALLFALLLAIFHSRPLTKAVAANLQDAHGAKEFLKALLSKESKEAIAETIQFAGYFLIAPLLFVNLIHDRRCEVLISRRRLALTTFFWAVLASIFYAFLNSGDLGFQGFFGSPNALSAFLAIALSLLAARLFQVGTQWHKIHWLLALAIVATFAVVSSLWSLLALLLGLVVASALASNRVRAVRPLVGFAAVALLTWLFAPAPSVIIRPHPPVTVTKIEPSLRAQSARLASATEKVKKQYVEWFVASSRLADSRESSFATGVGPGNYQFNIGSYYARLPNEEKMPPDSNNLYLVQAVNIGVLGLGVLLWIVLHFGNIALAARRKFPDDWLAAGVLGALAAWLFVNLFHAAIVRGTGVVFALILSFAIIAIERDWEPQDDLSEDEKRNFLGAGLS